MLNERGGSVRWNLSVTEQRQHDEDNIDLLMLVGLRSNSRLSGAVLPPYMVW